MNTKSNTSKKLLSLILSLAMMVTVVLPTSVFASEPAQVTMDIADTIGIDTATEFTVTTIPGVDENTMVLGKFEIVAEESDIGSLKYYATELSTWLTLPVTVDGDKLVGSFGPETTGFPLINATSNFEVTFANEGSYDVSVSIVDFETSNVIATTSKTVEVDSYADYTNLETAINAGEVYDDSVKEQYSADSYQALLDAIEAAKTVDEGLFASSQDVIDDATDAIYAAINALVSRKDISFMAVAVANDATEDYAKANKIVLVFSESIQNTDDVLAKLDNATQDAVDSVNWVNNTVCEMTLVDEHDLENGHTIVLTPDDEILSLLDEPFKGAEAEVAGNLEEAYEQVTATNMAATIVKATDEPGALAGDKIVLVFNAPVKDCPDTITVSGMTATVIDDTYNTVYEIELDGTENIDDSTLLDFDTITDVELNGTFGTAVAPKALVALAVDNDGTAWVEGDQIIVLFDQPTNEAVIDDSALANIVVGTAGLTLGEDSNATWENDTKLVITLGSEAVVENNIAIDISGLGIKDRFDMVDIENTELDVIGSFGTVTAPKALAALAVDNDGTAWVEGDEIVVVFDRATNGADIDLTVDGILSDGATFGDDSSYAWSETDTKLTITLGSTAVVSNGVKINLANQGIMDKDGIIDAIIDELTVEGSFGTVEAPVALNAYAVDNDGTAWVEGDEIVVVFDRATNGADIDLTVDGILSDDATFGDDSSYAWSDENTKLTITLGSTADVSNGVKINLANQGIMDKDGIIDAIIDELTVEGSFGTVEAPVALRAYAVDNDETYLVAGDQIVVVFDTPTNEADIDLKKNGVLTGVSGASFGTNSSYDWEEDATKLVITIGDTAVVSNGVKINLANQGIMDRDEIIDAITDTLEVEGSFGFTIQPRITKAVAFTQNEMDYIRVFFNTEVKAKDGDTIDIAISNGFEMGASARKELVDLNNGLTYYEIVMAKDEHGAFESGAYSISLTGIVDKETGTKELTSNSMTITGAFVSPITPEVLKVVAISNDGSGVAKPGDKIIAVFNTDVKLGTVSASEGYLGTGYSVNYSETSKNVVEITLGDAGLDVTPAETQITFADFMDEATESVTMPTTTKTVEGSFGYIVEPEILSATAVSKDGSGVAKAGDKIVVVFNTMVTYDGKDIYVYEYTLAHDGEYDLSDDIVDIFYITVVSKATGLTYDLEKEIGGSFGNKVTPAVKSVVLSEGDDGKEIITVVFDQETNKAALNDLFAKNSHLGQTVAYTWVDGYTLKITLGLDATTNKDSKLDLSDMGITPKDTTIAVTGINELEIKGILVPVVKTVDFVGQTIVIEFSARTNGNANISDLSTLLGTGATASWSNNNKTLTITLGSDYTISNNGYIVLNGMGIYDGFSGNHHVVGQYKVSGSVASDMVAVTKIVASSNKKDVATAQKGDKITIKFNSATDLAGATLGAELDSAAVDNIITIDGGNEVALGTGYTGYWSAYDTLVIVLGGSTETVVEGQDPVVTGNDPTITVGTEITVKNVAFANGTGEMDETSMALSGSFNGREFVLSEGSITRTSGNKGDYRVAVTVEDTLISPNVVPTIVCVAYSGKVPVSVMRITVDVESSVQPVFEFAEGLKITNAKIYVFNEVFGDANSEPTVLAETLEIEIED